MLVEASSPVLGLFPNLSQRAARRLPRIQAGRQEIRLRLHPGIHVGTSPAFLEGRELKSEQNKLTDFERTNNLAILQEERDRFRAYLAKLETQLSDSRLELKLLQENQLAQHKDGTNQSALPDTISWQGDQNPCRRVQGAPDGRERN